MKTNIHFWSYLAQSALELETIQTSVVKKIKICILCPIITPPPPKTFRLCNNVEKCGTGRQARKDNSIRFRENAICIPVK